MKKLLLLLVISSACHAEPFQSTKTVMCDSLPTLLRNLEPFKEKVIWSGAPEGPGNIGSTISLMEHPTNGSWTLIQYDSKYGCVLGVGTNLKS